MEVVLGLAEGMSWIVAVEVREREPSPKKKKAYGWMTVDIRYAVIACYQAEASRTEEQRLV